MSRLFRAVAVVWLVLAASVLLAAEYRGNKKSRVFHQESCRYFSCKNCTAKFASLDEAIDKGYRPCGTCRPAPSGRLQTLAASEESYSSNTSSRKFHRSSCRYASCGNCTAKFLSRAAAIKAGYAPGGCCKP